ncbi:unnamed protein product [Cuscuta epithymum]|uniref:Beta-glucosidase n=1 Tax=Cuscuta epithymum TaxID=186058 RepID=A0AAV0EQN8_9ASTE|nr:unnamed protein product [Cuscuta epithymum]CAH9125579.1 unnamed protein product [Cuscuta epithymum]
MVHQIKMSIYHKHMIMMTKTKSSPVLGLLILGLLVGLLDYDYIEAIVEPDYPFLPFEIQTTHFPPDFYFGTAIAAYQVEGAYNKSGKGPSIWDTFTHEHPERIVDGSNGDVAVDFYNKYREDIRLMSNELGMNAFRFSISWPRVIPSGRVSEGVNEEGIAFYNRVIDEARMNGLEPFVTIFHWDVPQALEDKYGGFLSPRIVSDYKDFAELCFERFGDRVKHWITLNEPYEFSMGGYEAGNSAPGRCSHWVNRACTDGDSSTEPYIVGHHLILCHAEAVRLYRRKPWTSGSIGKIGITLDVTWFLPLTNSLDDIEAAHRSIDFKFGWFMDPINYGQYPLSMRTLVGARLPEFTWEQKQIVKNSYDFIGINSYTSTYASSNFTPDPFPTHIRASTDPRVSLTYYKNGNPIGEQGTPDWLFVYPKGILDILTYTKHTYKDPLIYITENGIGDAVNLTRQETIKDKWRIDYHGGHLYYLRRAICEYKVRVKGYFVWTLTDNLEWANGFSVRMGLYSVDRSSKELTRTPKGSAERFHYFLMKRDRQGNGGVAPIPLEDTCYIPIPIRPPPPVVAANGTKVAHDEL